MQLSVRLPLRKLPILHADDGFPTGSGATEVPNSFFLSLAASRSGGIHDCRALVEPPPRARCRYRILGRAPQALGVKDYRNGVPSGSTPVFGRKRRTSSPSYLPTIGIWIYGAGLSEGIDVAR